jgi:uncharacterized Zn finger protein
MTDNITCALCGAELPEICTAGPDGTIKCSKCGAVLVTMEISDDVFQRLKEYATEVGRSPDQVIDQAIRYWITGKVKDDETAKH